MNMGWEGECRLEEFGVKSQSSLKPNETPAHPSNQTQADLCHHPFAQHNSATWSPFLVPRNQGQSPTVFPLPRVHSSLHSISITRPTSFYSSFKAQLKWNVLSEGFLVPHVLQFPMRLCFIITLSCSPLHFPLYHLTQVQ